MARRYMTKAEAVRDFVDLCEETGTKFSPKDRIGFRMAWNEHFDRLCRDGAISPANCDKGWTAPRSMPRRLVQTRHSRTY